MGFSVMPGIHMKNSICRSHLRIFRLMFSLYNNLRCKKKTPSSAAYSLLHFLITYIKLVYNWSIHKANWIFYYLLILNFYGGFSLPAITLFIPIPYHNSCFEKFHLKSYFLKHLLADAIFCSRSFSPQLWISLLPL